MTTSRGSGSTVNIPLANRIAVFVAGDDPAAVPGLKLSRLMGPSGPLELTECWRVWIGPGTPNEPAGSLADGQKGSLRMEQLIAMIGFIIQGASRRGDPACCPPS